MAALRLKLYAALAIAIVLSIWFGSTFHSKSPNFLDPFRSTVHSESSPTFLPQPIWLVATITSAHSLQRRSIIRATWQDLYGNDTLITTRFILANPGERWASVIAHENATYGDLIVLGHLEESAHVANTIKSIEFFKYLTEQTEQWRFVSKLDDDSFIDASTFYTKYLAPLLSTPENATPSQLRTIIARELRTGDFNYPGGQFYTMTWDLVELLSKSYRENPIQNEHEDILVGRLLNEANEPWHLEKLPNEVAFDYNDQFGQVVDGQETAWAAADDDLSAWVHGVGPGAINPHKMRGDEEYLKVAACFGTSGLLRSPLINNK
jgi:hypothetical protein